jgi:hypothetical protein
MWHKLSISSDDDKHLKSALEILSIPKIISFRVLDDTLYIYHKHRDGLEKIPFASKKTESIMQFIKSWLASIEYPTEPDHDGGNHKGFEVFLYADGGYCDYVDRFAKPYKEPFVFNENDIEHDGWAISIVVKPYWVEYHKCVWCQKMIRNLRNFKVRFRHLKLLKREIKILTMLKWSIKLF